MAADGGARFAVVRDAAARYDWTAAYDLVSAMGVADDPVVEAERQDLLAESAWWLGGLDDCIDARERAYRGYDAVGDHRRAGQCAVWLYDHHTFKAHAAMAGGWLR